MIADYFSPRYRSRAMGLYFVGAQLGIILGLALGGWINELADWRVAMFLVGAPGFVLAMVVMFTVKEPPRTPSQSPSAALQQPAGINETMRALFRHGTFNHLMIAGLLSSFTTGAVQAFTPAYIIRTFHLNTAQTGLTYGLTFGVAGVLGAVLGGSIGDRLRVANPPAALTFVAITMALGAPLMAFAFLSGNYLVFLALIFVAQVGSMVYAGPSFATVQSLVAPRMHAVASAVYLFALSGIGLSLGPLVAGMLSDWFKAHGSTNSLRWAMLAVIFPRLWSGFHFFLSARSLKREQKVLGVPAAYGAGA